MKHGLYRIVTRKYNGGRWTALVNEMRREWTDISDWENHALFTLDGAVTVVQELAIKSGDADYSILEFKTEELSHAQPYNRYR